MFLSYEQIQVSNTVLDVDDLNVPAKATHAMLQADTQPVRYTMDGLTEPYQTTGMVLLTTSPPELFLIEDLRRIKFKRGAASDGRLNIHYVGGRDI